MSTHVEIHYVSSLSFKGFSFTGMGGGLFNTSLYAFCVLAGMGLFWSTHVEMRYLSSLAWNGFGQHMFRRILCLRRYGMNLVKSC